VGASVLGESGARIAAALRGKSAHRQLNVHGRVRARSRLQQPMRAKPRLRAAA
jgi:hypothetical protein